jgi:hypothetical protein
MPRKVLTMAGPGPRADGAIQVEVTLPVRQCRREGSRTQHDPFSNSGDRPRIPRITRLMALAIKFQEMVERGEVRDYADLARLGYVTRARITQIMNLLMLAPDIQEHLLSPEGAISGLNERFLRSICAQVVWIRQRKLWNDVQPMHPSPSVRDNSGCSPYM